MTDPGTPAGGAPTGGRGALLALDGVGKAFGSGRRRRTVLRTVTLRVDAGEHVALIGASGAGKSTIARIVAGLTRPDSGTVWFEGHDVTRLRGPQRRALGRRLHLVFQDPYAALPQGRPVAAIVAEPLAIHERLPRAELRSRVHAALADVALEPPEQYAARRPAALSGGERQRVALARAVIARPRLIVADEPTAMLDASLRLDLLATLARLRTEHDTAILHITHDLALAAAFSDRLIVLADGRVVEQGPTRELVASPSAAATRRLVAAARVLDGTVAPPAGQHRHRRGGPRAGRADPG